MNVKIMANRTMIATDAFFRRLYNLHQHKVNPTNFNSNRRVLIVFQGLFGDAIVIQNSLKEYTRLFPKKDGYEITLLVRESVHRFMESVLILPKDITLESVDFTTFVNNYSYFRSVINKYGNAIWLLIAPGSSLSGEIFASASNATRKVALKRCKDVTKPITMAIFSRIAYTEEVRPQKEDMMLLQHRKLLQYLGDINYQARLPQLLKKERFVKDERYCVICPGASKEEKCWPIERFSEIADFIIEKYDMNIHLCGGMDEIAYEHKFLSSIKNTDRIVSHIGKTTFSEWSAIVQYAEIVVGNDSATIHLAAASRRKAICIAGLYDKYLFFPYKVDQLEEEDVLPITVMTEMPCEWCRTIGYYAGYGNKDCKKRINANQCALCIDTITVQSVKTEIDKLMEFNKS
ncbi:MAG: hypothetical protein LIO76_01410 [Clostridiales bacterium]|nr:hypothetical protein [Clostridiales bacterium]